MQRFSRRWRQAFTLIELLVVIAIIAILIALLVPAVQKVREAAARMHCGNNLKQLALGCHAYESTYKALPRNGIPPGKPIPAGAQDSGCCGLTGAYWSWIARILPYVEQDSLHKQMDIPNVPLNTNVGLLGTPLAILFCPSDTAIARKTRNNAADLGTTVVGLTNYKGNAGSNWNAGGDFNNPRYNTLREGLNNGDGILFRGDGMVARMKLTDITDGTSNTFMIGEDVPEFTNWNCWPYSNGSTATCAIPLNAKMPNGQPYPVNNWPNNYSFRSRHAGGGQFAMCDASVRFIREAIPLKTYRDLATRHIGEVVQLD